MIDLSSLNKEQREAVEHTNGPLLILAGAGSGKTRVLTYRIAYLLEHGIKPEEILAVTFTNKAANEMKERIGALINQKRGYISLPFMGTFHSVCVKILRAEGENIGIASNFTIYDSDDQLDAVKQAMKELNINIKEVNPRSVLYAISSAKNELLLPEEFTRHMEGYFHEIVSKIYPMYQNILKENNAVDFDDLIMKTVLGLREHLEIGKKYQLRFRHILVDEYQDTNKAQYSLIKLLGSKHRNIAVVGDDDQSIYAFRGATIENILHFEKDYPDATIVKLEQNYRSTKNILEAAYAVIQHNSDRKDKKLWTENPKGNKVQVFNAIDEQAEARFIAQEIKSLIEDDISPEETAVLYRTNAQSRSLEEAFLREGLNYRIVGGIRFYERKEIKDVLAYLRVIYNPKDNLSLVRIINVPRRGVGAKTISKIKTIAVGKSMGIGELLLWGMSDEADAQAEELVMNNMKINQFANVLVDLKRASTQLGIVELIKFTIDRSGYLSWLDDGTEENAARIENIQELVNVASKYDELESEAALEGFLTETATIEEEQVAAEKASKESEATTLMTLHAAKGLEFKYVFLSGMEEGLFPHSRSYSDPAQMSEERRLAYVGITRAREKLYMTHTESRQIYGTTQSNIVSRFIEDIPVKFVEKQGSISESGFNKSYAWESHDFDQVNDYVEKEIEKKPPVMVNYSEGDRVQHAIFGEGTVIAFDEDMVRVSFGRPVGVKSLAIEFANLVKL